MRFYNSNTTTDLYDGSVSELSYSPEGPAIACESLTITVNEMIRLHDLNAKVTVAMINVRLTATSVRYVTGNGVELINKMT